MTSILFILFYTQTNIVSQQIPFNNKSDCLEASAQVYRTMKKVAVPFNVVSFCISAGDDK